MHLAARNVKSLVLNDIQVLIGAHLGSSQSARNPILFTQKPRLGRAPANCTDGIRLRPATATVGLTTPPGNGRAAPAKQRGSDRPMR